MSYTAGNQGCFVGEFHVIGMGYGEWGDGKSTAEDGFVGRRVAVPNRGVVVGVGDFGETLDLELCWKHGEIAR